MKVSTCHFGTIMTSCLAFRVGTGPLAASRPICRALGIDGGRGFMVSYVRSPELNSVATEVRTGALKVVGLKLAESCWERIEKPEGWADGPGGGVDVGNRDCRFGTRGGGFLRGLECENAA